MGSLLRSGFGEQELHAPLPGQRLIEVICDDVGATAAWQQGLAAEGLAVRTVALDQATFGPRPQPAPSARVLFLARGMADQLSRLRELRGMDASVPLLAVFRSLRDLDHVLALEMGADDVIEADLAAPVVAARLRALWRRMTNAARSPSQPEQLQFGRLSLHLRDRRVLLDERAVPLTEGEFEVLWLLASRAGSTVTRMEILRQVRGLDYQRLDRSIDCRVYRIRAKLGDTQPDAHRLRTVRNRGYVFLPAGW
jgi:two-component system, OmpR family, response regulator RstA